MNLNGAVALTCGSSFYISTQRTCRFGEMFVIYRICGGSEGFIITLFAVLVVMKVSESFSMEK